MKKTVNQALAWATEKLKESKITTPQLDAELLLASTLGKSREYLLAHPEQKISDLQIENYKLKIVRHSLAEPLAYITGHKEFFGLDFKVTKDTLIPRPETELLVEEALGTINNPALTANQFLIIDVGTGSGNIIISLAKNIQRSGSSEGIKLFATDSSRKALEVAKQNAEQHGVLDDVTFLSGRFLNPLLEEISIAGCQSQVIILANLPYLSESIYNSVPVSVKNFEPKEALLSGSEGLDHYSKLLNQMAMIKLEHKMPLKAFFEISPEQKQLIIKKVKVQLPKAKVSLKKDLAGKWRVLKLEI